MRFIDPTNNPLADIDECDDFKVDVIAAEQNENKENKKRKECEPTDTVCDSGKEQAAFRNYTDGERQDRVSKFYKLQHISQTVEFVKAQKEKYCALDKCEMGIWECLEMLDTLVDESDPDTDVTQLQHALQAAEAIRKQYPDNEWFPVVGLIHDLGKILSLKFEEPQWAVVGDSFPVGCQFSSDNVFPDTFTKNSDYKNPDYSTKLGMYTENCGLDNVHLSWGHDEYLYQVCVRNGSTLPLEGLYMIRYHSFYPWHKEGAYTYLTDETDKKMLPWVQKFNPFDLYSKGDLPKDASELCEYYKKQILKFFPEKLKW